MKIIKVNGIDFKVNLIVKKRNKNIYLRIKEDTLQITSPLNFSEEKIKEYIIKNYNTIVSMMNKKTVKNENKIHYLGLEYELELKKSINEFVYINGNKFIVEYSKETSIQKLISKFYLDSLITIIDYHKDEIYSKFGLKNIPIYYKYVKTFYGKCYPKQKKILLNIMLAKYDIKYILSVLYHECAHFKYQNHQIEYYKYLESIYPNYRKVQKELRSIKFNEKY